MTSACCNGIVQFNHYGENPVQLAADLVNDPPADAAALTERCLTAGVRAEAPATASDLRAVRRYLDAWLEVVDTPSADDKAELLNRLLAQSAAYPRLTRHDEHDWHLHFRDHGLPLSGVLAALFSVGTALHLTSRGMGRLGRCAAEGCDRVYADVSRNGRQRYCSPACANRDAVRRHRTRMAGSAP